MYFLCMRCHPAITVGSKFLWNPEKWGKGGSWFTVAVFFLFSSSGSLYFNNPLLRASISEGSSSGADQYFGEERDSVLVMEDIPATEENVYNEVIPTEAPIEDSQVEEQTVAFEFLDNLNIKVYFTISYLIYTVSLVVISWLQFVVNNWIPYK